MKKIVIAAAALALAAASCTTVKSYGVADYYPLKKDAAWTYRVTSFEHTATGDSLVSTARVVGEKDGEFQLQQGEERYAYLLTKEGLMKAKNRSFILKEPLDVDAAWAIEVSGGGLTLKGQAKITAKSAEVQAGAKKYQDCVVVEERFEGVGRHVSTYCPGTGLVRLEVFETANGAEKLLSKAELLGTQGVGD